MAEPKNPAERRKNAEPAQNAAQLKREIESGAQGDKVSYPDPGASPLGTDDEAAGRPAHAEPERIELSSRTAARSDAARRGKPFRRIRTAPRADPDDEADRVETTPGFRLAVFGGAALIIAAAIGLKVVL